ncbi:MAG: MotA/TolQ/ExbB proton channel family protein [Elusimicrobia bacterium]|nr:MotA/TolQ/ExbB proton channel family protein [Elusimicrobiota bacterium]
MDLMTIGGIACGFGVIYYVLATGHMTQFLFNFEAIVLIFGGTLGSIMISYPWSALRKVPLALRIMFFPPKRPTAQTLIECIVKLAEKARRDGIDSLSEETPYMPHPYLGDCIQMLVEGLEHDMIQERCERDILTTQQRHDQISGIFRSAGAFAPIFGLLGTLIGVVQVLRNITDPKAMGTSMAIAMTASFYGIFSANFLFLPIANKLSHYSEEEVLARELITKGILALQQDEAPWLISKRLEAYLSFHLRARGERPYKVAG